MRSKLAFALASLLLVSSAHANLLVNGGAETGSLEGWTAGGESNPAIDDGRFDAGIDPHSGAYMFMGGRGATGSLSQNVVLGDGSAARRLRLSFWQQGLDQGTPSDSGYVSLTYRAPDGSILGVAASEVLDAHDGAWQQYRGWFDVPASAYSVDYTMHFVRNFGYDLDSFFDGNVLDLFRVPEPGTLALGLIGALAIFSLRKRRGA